jgi:hypothetical protein
MAYICLSIWPTKEQVRSTKKLREKGGCVCDFSFRKTRKIMFSKIVVDINQYKLQNQLYYITTQLLNQQSIEITKIEIFQTNINFYHNSKTPIKINLYSLDTDYTLEDLYNIYTTKETIISSLKKRFISSLAVSFIEETKYFIKEGQVFATLNISTFDCSFLDKNIKDGDIIDIKSKPVYFNHQYGSLFDDVLDCKSQNLELEFGLMNQNLGLITIENINDQDLIQERKFYISELLRHQKEKIAELKELKETKIEYKTTIMKSQETTGTIKLIRNYNSHKSTTKSKK